MGEELTKLISAVGNLKEYQGPINLTEIQDALNALFPHYECVDFMYTQNTDKIPFGVIITPVLTSDHINKILLSGEEMGLPKYNAEIDSKVFQYGLDAEEATAILIYDIVHMCSNSTPVKRLREAIDEYFVTTQTQLKIKDSIQYQQILAFGLVDTLIKFSNCLYLDHDVVSDAYLDSIGLGESFTTAISKLFNNIPGMTNDASRMPGLIILDWCFRLYGDVEHQRIPAIKQLERSKDITASVLYKRIVDRAIDALYKIDTDSLIIESTLNKVKRDDHSVYAQIESGSLESMEDDFYEFVVRLEQAELDEDIRYILKEANLRLAILDNYIKNDYLTESDKEMWTDQYIKYSNLRDRAGKNCNLIYFPEKE